MRPSPTREIYEFLEAEGTGYAIRLPANRVLQDKIGYPPGALSELPPQKMRGYHASFRYQAGSWSPDEWWPRACPREGGG
jgi:hypothetical protein